MSGHTPGLWHADPREDGSFDIMNRESRCLLAMIAGISWVSFALGGVVAFERPIPPFWFYLIVGAAGCIALAVGGYMLEAFVEKRGKPE